MRHILLPLTLAAACTPAPDEQPRPPTESDAAQTNRIDVPVTVRKNLGITFAKVEARRVASTLRIPGSFELEPLARREYRMALSGHVEILVAQFQTVAEGDVLYRFRSPQWPELQHEIIEGEQAIGTAKAEIEVARATSVEAELKLDLLKERLAALREAEFKSADLEAEAAVLAASLPRLETEMRAAETRLENARRTRQHALHRAATASGLGEEDLEHVDDGEPAYSAIDWIEVSAAEAGVVEALHATNGAFLESPEVVLSTVDPARVRFHALALQADLDLVASATEARIVPPLAPGRALDDALDASIALGLEAHPAERTLSIIATPHGARSWARPGVSAFLEVVVSGTDAPTLAVPRSAIVQDGIQHVFFRRDPKDPNKVIRIEADLGVDDGRWVAIQSGLRAGDEVVLSGAYELKLSSERSGGTPKGGHFHGDGTFHAGDD